MSAWNTIEFFARYYGPQWINIAAQYPALGYAFPGISKGRAELPALAQWPEIVRYARRHGGGFVDVEWLAAMAWYSNAITITPDYRVARISLDPRLRELAQRHAHMYGPICAPLLPWEALQSAPTGGRWDCARWVALVVHNGGPYQQPRRT